MVKLRILIACEFSGIVREAFRLRGHDVWSCDLLPTEIAGQHIQDDVLLHLEDGWDMMIAFPPCTYLCSSGLHWNSRRAGRSALTHEAMLFVFSLIDAPIEHIAIENPIGCISTNYRKPDQIIQPHQFGEDASKSTCLWLKKLPLLQPTKIIPPKYACYCKFRFDEKLGKYGCPNCNAETGPAKLVWGNQTPGGQNRLGPSEKRAMERSRTYVGIADAMAEQWGGEQKAGQGALWT